VIVGDMDSVSDARSAAGAEILVHAYRDGDAPGEARLQRLGVPFHDRRRAGISEDIALLLAHEKGAELIVAVGTHFNLVEFLEREPRRHVVDVRDAAEGGGDPDRRQGRLAARQPRIGVWPLALFGVAAMAALLVAILASPALRNVFGL
jgi:uncharacterized membrane-anchored protein